MAAINQERLDRKFLRCGRVFHFSFTYSRTFDDLFLHIETRFVIKVVAPSHTFSILNTAGHQSPEYPCSPSVFYTRSSINDHHCLPPLSPARPLHAPLLSFHFTQSKKYIGLNIMAHYCDSLIIMDLSKYIKGSSAGSLSRRETCVKQVTVLED